MSHHDDGDDNSDDERPLYTRRRQNVLRITVLVCVAALVLPGILSIVSHYAAFAHAACWRAAHYSDATTVSTWASFELFGPGGIGWECYATGATGERHVASLGLLPSDITPSGPTQRA